MNPDPCSCTPRSWFVITITHRGTRLYSVRYPSPSQAIAHARRSNAFVAWVRGSILKPSIT